MNDFASSFSWGLFLPNIIEQKVNIMRQGQIVNISTLVLIDKYNTLSRKRRNTPKRIRASTMPTSQNTLQTMLDEVQKRSRVEGSWILEQLVH